MSLRGAGRDETTIEGTILGLRSGASLTHVTVGVFSKDRVGRSLDEEYDAKSTVRFNEGTCELAPEHPSIAIDLFEGVRFGPAQELAEPGGPGIFRVVRIPTDCSEASCRFDYAQPFTLPSGELYEIEIFGLDFTAQGERGSEPLRLNEDYLTHALSMQGLLAGESIVSYSSSTYELLPLWDLRIDLEDGSIIWLDERFLPSENNLSTGPASLVRARIELGGTSQTVADYWRLVYAAERHNRQPRYRVILDPPIEVNGVDVPVRAVEVGAAEAGTGGESPVFLLGEGFEVLAARAVASFRRSSPAEREEGVRFRRGDVNSDARIDGSDAIRILEFLLRRGRAPDCAKAADADDNGRVELSDAVAILAHLYRGKESLPEPFSRCGADPTPDDLGCDASEGCHATQ